MTWRLQMSLEQHTLAGNRIEVNIFLVALRIFTSHPGAVPGSPVSPARLPSSGCRLAPRYRSDRSRLKKYQTCLQNPCFQ